MTELTTVPSGRCTTCGDTGILGRGDRIPTEADLDAAQHNLDVEMEQESGSEANPETETWVAVSPAMDRFATLFDSIPD